MIRPIHIEGDVARVLLTQGYEAILDAADVPLVEGRNWCAKVSRKTIYAVTNRRGRGNGLVGMHNVITGFAMVDHRNGDGLDNRRQNLRAATHDQNQQNRGKSATNTSGLKGAFWDRSHRTWQSKITVGNRQIHLGCFDTREAAHAAYCEASIRLHGEFGRTT